MVKPDAVQHLGKILDAISQAGFILRLLNCLCMH